MSSNWKSTVLSEARLFEQSFHGEPFGTFGARFFEFGTKQFLQPPLSRLLVTFRHIAFRYEAIIQNYTTATRYECDFLLLWTHETLSIQLPDGVDDVQSIIRLAVLVHAMIRIWDLQGVEGSGILAHNMRQRVLATSTILQNDAPDLLVWILFLGGLLSQGRKGHEWWVYKLADAARRISITQWDSLLVVLEGFCFIYRKTDKPARDLWNETLEVMGC